MALARDDNYVVPDFVDASGDATQVQLDALGRIPMALTSGVAGAWVASDFDDNAESTATKALSADHTHYLASVTFGYSADPAAAKTCVVSFGAVAQFTFTITAAGYTTVPFPVPLNVGEGVAVSAVLAASGTGGVVGTVIITGFTD